MVNFDRLREIVRVRTSLRRYCLQLLAAWERPPAGSRAAVIGPDPIRIVLFGSGIALGYNVTDKAGAVESHLARLLAEHSQRGVVVQNRGVDEVPMSLGVQRLGNVGAHTYQVAIWAPSYVEVVERTSLSSWRRELENVVVQVRRTEQTKLVLLCLPYVEGLHPMAVLARPALARLNRVIQDVAERTPDTFAVEPASARMGSGNEPWFSAEYYRLTAKKMLPAISALLGLPVDADDSEPVRGSRRKASS